MHSPAWFLLLAVSMLQPSEKSGIKMTVEFGQAGNSSEHILHLWDDRKRMEFRNLRSQPA